MERVHLFIEGKVQGVGFRHFTAVRARKAGIRGWVKNLTDGRVEAVFEGGGEAVQELVRQCNKGPLSARVDRVEVNREDPEGERGFEVRYI